MLTNKPLWDITIYIQIINFIGWLEILEALVNILCINKN
jgi:hypothetical protein